MRRRELNKLRERIQNALGVQQYITNAFVQECRLYMHRVRAFVIGGEHPSVMAWAVLWQTIIVEGRLVHLGRGVLEQRHLLHGELQRQRAWSARDGDAAPRR